MASPQNESLESANGDNSPAETSKVGSAVSRKHRRKDWWQKRQSAGKSESKSDGQIKKLRDRNSIPKPDSLKYEPDLNKGFHAKLLQNLYVDSSKKKKKKANTQNETSKRKNTESGPGSPKKPKVAAEPEVFDSYKFSMKLINGEVDVAKDSPGGKDSKDKYVLFVGNLPYDVTREQLEEHFRKTGGIKSIRIPRDKASDKGRGFAYMEFDGRISHGIALRLHQTTLGGRKINVEFTSIGGGKSAARREKLKQKNHKRKRMKMQ